MQKTSAKNKGAENNQKNKGAKNNPKKQPEKTRAENNPILRRFKACRKQNVYYTQKTIKRAWRGRK